MSRWVLRKAEEDIGALMRSLDLEPPPLMLRLAARRSARRYRKGR